MEEINPTKRGREEEERGRGGNHHSHFTPSQRGPPTNKSHNINSHTYHMQPTRYSPRIRLGHTRTHTGPWATVHLLRGHHLQGERNTQHRTHRQATRKQVCGPPLPLLPGASLSWQGDATTQPAPFLPAACLHPAPSPVGPVHPSRGATERPREQAKAGACKRESARERERT